MKLSGEAPHHNRGRQRSSAKRTTARDPCTAQGPASPDPQADRSYDLVPAESGGYKALWEQCLTTAPVGMALLDLQGHWTSVNPALCALLGYRRDELVSRHFSELTFPDDQEKGEAALSHLRTGRATTVSVEKRYRHKDGHPITMLIRSNAVPGQEGKPDYLVCHYEAIGNGRMTDTHLAHLALHDPLTGLANRALLADRLQHHLAALAGGGGVLAVLVADLDEFKQVNDQYGPGHVHAQEVGFARGVGAEHRRLGSLAMILQKQYCRELPSSVVS